MIDINKDTHNNAGAAAAIGISPSTLNTWRSRGQGPKWHRIAGRIRYFKADIQSWLESQMAA